MKLRLGVCAVLAATLAGPQAGAAEDGSPPAVPVEVWMGHYNPEHLVTQHLEWDEVRRGIDVVEFFVNMVAFRTPMADYEPCLAELRRSGIKVAIQCGYFDWEPQLDDFATPNPKGISDQVRLSIEPGIGAVTARIEMKKLEAFIAVGGTPDYLVLDGPVRRLMHPGADTGRTTPDGEARGIASLDAAVDEVIAYMKTWRERFPNVQFIALTNFPNWGWKGEIAYWASGPNGLFWGDYYPVVRALIAKSREAGLPLAGLRADNPYDYALGKHPVPPPWPAPSKDPSTVDWMDRLLDLERVVESEGVPFDVIYNCEAGGGTSPTQFEDETLVFIDAHRRAGGSPTRYVIEGWYKHPEHIGPETEAGSLTHLVREAIRRVKGGAPDVGGSPASARQTSAG